MKYKLFIWLYRRKGWLHELMYSRWFDKEFDKLFK